MLKKITIVSRKSELAMWQTQYVQRKLQDLYPKLQVLIVGVATKGDKILDSSLAKIGGKGLFVKELEEHLLAGKADIAVHSFKDMPYQLPLGLEICTVLKREDPRDALLSKVGNTIMDLPKNAVVGTSSLRRQSQLLALRSDLQVKILRGNVPTRISKLHQGEYDAIILAAAGLKRLNLISDISSYLPTDIMLPAVGQGAIAIECLNNNVAVKELLLPLNDIKTWAATTAERAMNQQLLGSCQVPIAGFAEINADNVLNLRGLVADPQGSKIIKAAAFGEITAAKAIGEKVAQQLLNSGAKEILEELK